MPEILPQDPPITPELWREMGLIDSEFEKINRILGREPTYTELGMFSVMWSEHCGYKYSRPVLRLFRKYREQLDSGTMENAGVVDIGDGIGVVMKMESHNHPSAVEPFQGAATGVGGILRDIFTMGARPVASLNSLRFGSLDDPHVRYLFEHVVAGIGFYGNCVGVPTIGGEVYFDKSYAGNPLVNAMSVGTVQLDSIASAKAEGIGNSVMIVGSRTGRDGIHGATFASVELGPDSESKRPNVQMGDPFTEKLLIEATLEALKTGYIAGIQDMGAAGITCSTCETSAKAGTGMEIDVALVPQREAGMTPYEVMLSESQERMLAIVQKGKEDEVASVFKKWGLNAVVVGFVTGDGLVRIKQNGVVVAEVPAKALADDCPTYYLEAGEPDYIEQTQSRSLDSVKSANLQETLFALLGSPTIASKKWVWEQYDHMVQTNTTVLPGSDAGVLRLRGVKTGLAVTADCNSKYVYLNPFLGSKYAVYEAARNLACTGAKPAAVTDCLNFGNPEKSEVFWQFQESVKGIAEASEELDTPVISGNVSFYNETPESAIYPTPVIGMLGIIKDVSKRVSSEFKCEGDDIILIHIGWPDGAFSGLAGSEFQWLETGEIFGGIPELKEESQRLLINLLIDQIGEGNIKSAHDVSEGGLAVCLAECAMSSGIGCDVRLKSPLSNEASLYGEHQGFVIVTAESTNSHKILNTAREFGLYADIIGVTGADRISISLNGRDVISISVDDAKSVYESAIPSAMEQ